MPEDNTGAEVTLDGGVRARVVGLPAPIHPLPTLGTLLVCTVCNLFAPLDTEKRPGDRCGRRLLHDDTSLAGCGGVLRYGDGRAYSAVIAVGRGIAGMRSRSDIATDVAGAPDAADAAVIRRFVEAVCDLLHYLPEQSMFTTEDTP
jgi:hypothetical protein